MLSSFKKIMVFFLIIIGSVANIDAAIYYVKSGTINGNGSSWNKAFGDLDSALSKAALNPGPNQIWIAAGTYKPNTIYKGGYSGNEPNLKTFLIPNNVSIYGGFIGNETSLSARTNTNLHPTILSGDLSGDDINDPNNLQTNKADNAWHVLTADGVTNVLLDSLIIRDGYASGPDSGTVSTDGQFNILTIDYEHAGGGGLLVRHGSQITLNNLNFGFNASDSVRALTGPLVGPPQLGSPAEASGGGAISAIDANTIVTIKSTTFNYNSGFNFGSNGGALNSLLESSLIINGSSFTNNIANRNGGAIHTKNGEIVSVTSSNFTKNKIVILPTKFIGDESGGAIGTNNTNLKVSSSLFDSNEASSAGGGAIFFHIPFDDGEIYALSVDSSVFQNNKSGSIGGGAINIFGTKPHVGANAKISNSVFKNNVAAMGGGVYTDSIPVVLTNSLFTGNQAWVNGGAVFGSNFGDVIFGVTDLANRTILNISNSAFSSNSIIGVPSGVAPPVFVFNLFASFQASLHSLPPAGVTALNPGGGAIASELEGNIIVSNSAFLRNTAPNGNGGAILVGGSQGFSGLDNLGMNQAYLKITRSACSGNSATLGGNNSFVLDPANLGNNPNGVFLDNPDGSCK